MSASEETDPAEVHALGTEAFEAADYEAAERLARAALAGFVDELGEDHPDVANAWLLLGRVLRRVERLDEAGAALEKACAILAPDFDADEETCALIAGMRAVAAAERADQLRLCGRVAEALAVADAAIARAEREPAIEPAFVASLRVARGVVRKYAGDSEGALADYLAAEPDLADEGRATLDHNLGGIHHERGALELAEGFARRGIERRRATGNAPDLAADLAALAPIVAERGRLEEANSLLVEALDILEATFGSDHHEVAVARSNLAGVRLLMNQIPEAEAGYRAAVASFEKAGHATRDFALALDGLAVLLEQSGRGIEAAAVTLRRDEIGAIS